MESITASVCQQQQQWCAPEKQCHSPEGTGPGSRVRRLPGVTLCVIAPKVSRVDTQFIRTHADDAVKLGCGRKCCIPVPACQCNLNCIDHGVHRAISGHQPRTQGYHGSMSICAGPRPKALQARMRQHHVCQCQKVQLVWKCPRYSHTDFAVAVLTCVAIFSNWRQLHFCCHSSDQTSESDASAFWRGHGGEARLVE